LSCELHENDEIRAGHTVIRLNVQSTYDNLPVRVADLLSHTPVPLPSGVFPTVPGYSVLREQGRDGLGIVYLGRRQSDEQPGTITPSLRPTPPQLDDFLRSARFLLKLQHPHIVQLCDLGVAGDQLFFVSEYFVGLDTATLVKREGPQRITRVLRWASQMLQAL